MFLERPPAFRLYTVFLLCFLDFSLLLSLFCYTRICCAQLGSRIFHSTLLFFFFAAASHPSNECVGSCCIPASSLFFLLFLPNKVFIQFYFFFFSPSETRSYDPTEQSQLRSSSCYSTRAHGKQIFFLSSALLSLSAPSSHFVPKRSPYCAMSLSLWLLAASGGPRLTTTRFGWCCVVCCCRAMEKEERKIFAVFSVKNRSLCSEMKMLFASRWKYFSRFFRAELLVQREDWTWGMRVVAAFLVFLEKSFWTANFHRLSNFFSYAFVPMCLCAGWCGRGRIQLRLMSTRERRMKVLCINRKLIFN